MPKLDPGGEVLNPIRSKLAGSLGRPLHAVTAEVKIPLPVEPVPVVQVVTPAVEEPAPSTKLAKPKKVLFTVLEQKENDVVLQRLGDAIGTDTLGWSHVNRALWSLLRRVQDHIGEKRSHAPQLFRPSNGNPIEMARFEDALAQYLLALFKDMPRDAF